MRPEILFALFAPASSLKGVGPKIAPLVERAAGPLVRDVLFLAPQALIERPEVRVADALDGQIQTFKVVVEAHLPPARPNLPYTVRCSDETGPLFLTWFKGYGRHLIDQHPLDSRRVVSGRAERFGAHLTMAHPDYLLAAERADEIPRHEPVYPTTAGLPSRTLRRISRSAIERAPLLPEWQDHAWLTRHGWPDWHSAIVKLHSPLSVADLDAVSPARRRLAYDELLAHHLAMAQRKAERRAQPAPSIPHHLNTDAIVSALPFKLTGAQLRTLADIGGDLASGERMSRLVQGDVGSGKTVVAMLSMADVAASGGQSTLMAPTEILARQHFETLAQPLEKAGVRAILLTGRDKGAERAAKLRALASGEAQVAVGTHALFQDEVEFKSLTLAVIDEQHRFGVNERRRLQAKGDSVHLLALSATPIPRTLELTLYGDLDVSRLDEKPPGRKPVTTTAAPSNRLGEIVDRLRKAVSAGAQAFWICPLVSESDVLVDITAAEARAAMLRQALGERTVGLVHGKLPSSDKDAVMSAFAAGEIGVLVATTVVEVGVNVPNANIMVIEHADRFGLAQLHQLRGRVGRGGAQSACLLLYDPPLSATGQARLNVLRATEDGFAIAEKDLELRGGGDALGLRQSGLPDYHFVDAAAHRDLMLAAADDARLILHRDPNLESPRGEALKVLQALFDWKPDGAWSSAG